MLNITALGATLQDAVNSAYAGVNKIDWPGGFCRRDIGHREMAREIARG